MAIVGRIVDAEHGYAITLPASWLRLDIESGLAQFVAAAAIADPSIAARCESSTPEELQACLEEEVGDVQASFAELTEAGAQIAMDLTTIGKPLPSFVLILPQPKAFGITSDLLLATGPSSLRAVGIRGRIQSGLLNVPAGTAVYFYYTMPPSELTNARARDFYVVTEDRIYEVLVVGHKTDQTIIDVADALIRSLEILP